jgi:glycerol-3-phosphate O-acyltransferase/dihydroxyacetone phosphate acyltransferase
MGYRLVRLVIRILLKLFYGCIDVVGRERIPATGPLIVAANHHNSVVDAMLIVATFPRAVRVLANAPLFKNPLVGPFLRLMGAVPVNRRSEAGDDPGKNDALFAAAIGALRAGGALLIFPEGRTTPRPTLLPLRTGAARILFGAERAAGPCGTTLLPVGLIFHDPGTFRAGSALVMIGPPVPTPDLVAGADAPAESGVRALTERLTEAIRGQIVEADDRHTLALLDVLEQAWAQEQGPTETPDRETGVAWRRRVMCSARELAQSEPHRVAELRRHIELYRAHLDEVGLSSDQLDRPWAPAAVLRNVGESVVMLALGLPLALWGIACHAVPYLLVGRAVRWLGRTWRERLERVGRQVRAFGRFFADRRLRDDLRAERAALVRELTRLAAMVREP